MHSNALLQLITRTALTLTLFCGVASAQQIVQRGALGFPAALLDENAQWSAPVELLSNGDVSVFMPDISNAVWLDSNAERFLNTGEYTLTLVTFYKTRRTCRTDQVLSGFSDAGHIDACNVILYRVRQIAVNTPQKTITLLMTGTADESGTVDPGSVLHETRTRGFKDLGDEALGALTKATEIIGKQALAYDRRVNNIP